ncbi:MAG: EthD domain-containing protein [Candidatus Binataceae bacterium]
MRSLAKVLNARKYVQSHTIEPERNVALAATRGMPEAFDGITEVWFDSLDSLNGLDTAEARAADRALIEDESKFVDLKRSYALLTEEHTIFDL